MVAKIFLDVIISLYMSQTAATRKINRTAEELQDLVKRSKRKLLEFDVAMSLLEIKQGKVEVFKDVDRLFRDLA